MRALLAFAVIAVLPVLALVDVVGAFRAGWWTSSSIWEVVVWLSGVVLVTDLLLLATPRGRAFLHRRAPAVVLFVVVLVGSAFGADRVVDAAVRPTSWYHRYVPGHQQIFQTNEEHLPGIRGEARHTANSLGIRGPELPPRDQALRILCVGGSTTACLMLDDSETWPQRLAEHLRAAATAPAVWVGDVGRSGYGTWHHVRLMENEELLTQMDCALFLVGINDFMRALQRRPIHSPIDVGAFWEDSAIFKVLHNAYQARKQRRQHREETSDHAIYITGRQQRRDGAKIDQLPDMQSGLREFRGNVRTMIERCRDLGVTPVFATQPVLHREGLGEREEGLMWLGGQPDGSYLSTPAMRRGMDLFNQALQEVCGELGVGCVDLSALSGQPAYYYDGCHFTEAGAEAVGKHIATWWNDARPLQSEASRQRQEQAPERAPR